MWYVVETLTVRRMSPVFKGLLTMQDSKRFSRQLESNKTLVTKLGPSQEFRLPHQASKNNYTNVLI